MKHTQPFLRRHSKRGIEAQDQRNVELASSGRSKLLNGVLHMNDG